MSWPGEKLLERLWVTLAEKGVGSLLRPWQRGREGKVDIGLKRAEMLVMAQTERDAEDIRSGRRSLREFPGDLPFGPLALAAGQDSGQPKDAAEGRSGVAIAARLMIADTVRREVNVSKAIAHAEDELKNDPEPPPTATVDSDWLYRWRENAGAVSAEHLQQLWGRVLAGELKSPGFNSLRVLDFLRNLSTEEAKRIEHLFRFVVEDAIWKSESSHLASEGVDLSFLLKMQDLGVISGVESVGFLRHWASAEQDRFIAVLRSFGKALLLKHEDPKKQVTLEVYPLTEIGQRVLRLGHFEPHLEYLRRVGTSIAQQGFSVFLGDCVQVSNVSVRVLNEVPIPAVGPSPEPSK